MPKVLDRIKVMGFRVLNTILTYFDSPISFLVYDFMHLKLGAFVLFMDFLLFKVVITS